MAEKILLALDFDHTMIDGNSDLHIIKLAPNGELPQQIQEKYSDTGWTEYMGAIFSYLHSHGTTEQNYRECLSEVPLTAGMAELFSFIKDKEKFETIIISDANSFFINLLLEKFGLKDSISQVFTNPAIFDQQGCLTIEYYHTQDWCTLSTVNLCKGHILQEYIRERSTAGVNFAKVLYVGDGSNDLCPGLSLSEKDYLLPRVGFSLWKKINKRLQNKEDTSLKAQIYPWKSGCDIVQLINDKLQ